MSKLEESKSRGAHGKLASMAGTWKGTTKTWFEKDKLADESPMEGTLKLILDGRFLLHEYKGSMMGKPFEGMAVYGYHIDTDKFQSAWIDSFHMGTGIMFSEGVSGDHFNVKGSYGAGRQTWGWRTELMLDDAGKLIITAYNVTPEGEEAKATETIYERVGN